MAKKITFNSLSNNFDYTTDTTPIEAEIANKQAKVTDAEKNHIAMFNDLGQTVDSGFSTDDFRKKSETVNIDDVENLSDIIAEKMTANDVQSMIEATHSEEPWGADSNANDYNTSGVYQFAGWRKNLNDNLPIANYDEDGVDRNNIAFTLVVNAKEGYLVRNDEGNVTRNIPTMIAQTLMIGNRRGSDTKIYTRHGQKDLNTNTTTWEAWREVMTSTYLDIVDSYTGDVLNGATEIGLYTGAMVDLVSNTADVFKLEVINNYAVTTQVSAAMSTSIPNSVLQTITILNLDGNNATKKRTGTYNGSGYDWSEWKENTSATPNWNQNDENAADYIKNRTHYEIIKDFAVLTDSSYNEKEKSGSVFVANKVIGSVTLTSPEVIQNDYSDTECYKLVSGVQNRNYSEGSYFSNPTSTCRTLRINGIIVQLEWLSYIDGTNIKIHYSPEGERVFYGFGEGTTAMSNKYIVGNGIVIKDYAYWYNSNGQLKPYLSYLIDTSIYGNGPYTIEFLFESEQTIKKLDEKFIPDSIKRTTIHKRGDVVILQQKKTSTDYLTIGTKVISWEEFKETYQNYHCSGDIHAEEEFPIGLVADPDKRTFLYLKELDGVYESIKNNIESLGNTFYSNGIENTHLIKLLGISITDHSGIFYNGSNSQLNQFIPSVEESVMGKAIDSNDAFYFRLVELNKLMNDSIHYPIPYGPYGHASDVFYCLNSTFIKSGNSFYAFNGYGDSYSITYLGQGYMEFFGIYFND